MGLMSIQQQVRRARPSTVSLASAMKRRPSLASTSVSLESLESALQYQGKQAFGPSGFMVGPDSWLARDVPPYNRPVQGAGGSDSDEPMAGPALGAGALWVIGGVFAGVVVGASAASAFCMAMDYYEATMCKAGCGGTTCNRKNCLIPNLLCCEFECPNPPTIITP